jgi:hypothetical protein
MLALSRPVVAWSASGRCFAGARYCAIGASGQLRGASGRWFDRWGSVTIGGSNAVERVRSVSIGAFGHPEKYPVKGYNGSICLGCL